MLAAGKDIKQTQIAGQGHEVGAVAASLPVSSRRAALCNSSERDFGDNRSNEEAVDETIEQLLCN